MQLSNNNSVQTIRPETFPTTTTLTSPPSVCPLEQISCQSPDCVQLSDSEPCHHWCIPKGETCSYEVPRPTAVIPSSASPCKQQEVSDANPVGPRMCGVTPSTVVMEDETEDGNVLYYWIAAFIVMALVLTLGLTAAGLAVKKRHSR